ncbi:MAG: hypothetical protein PWP23_923 [Candidatus Sumerlaeota bacterium]|nr:hypothetical protein [Candidatus Sumerlaeota bacterium]
MQPQKPPAELLQAVDAFFEDERFANAFWGAKIKSLDTGEVWYERNSDKLFMPASNEKIPTTAAALVTLGPDWQFTTHFTTNGEIRNGVLEGDLIVFGNGDPTLYSRFYDDPRDVFRLVAQRFHDLGITRITGDIIGDDNAFDDEHIGYGWPLDGLPSWYSAEFGALQINEGYVDLTVRPPADANGTVTIEPNLPSDYYTIDNRVVVRPGRNRISSDRAFGTNNLIVRGSVAPGSNPQEVSPTITNPTLFYVTVLAEVLRDERIDIGGKPMDCDDIAAWNQKPEDFTSLYVHKSPPLSEIIKGLMKRSQNLYAETMARVLGWEVHGNGSFRNGRRVVSDVLKGFGVEPGTYRYMDGSGLSRYNFISPDILVKILEGMHEHEYWPEWRESMPIAGVDGTLARRMRGTPAEGNVRAKTGTISNVRGLSGYVTTADGEELVFSFLVNAHIVSSAATEDVTDGVLALLAGYDSGAAPGN